jgi:ClpP class serine protease
LDLSNGLALIINSPGGLGISAERIINICKNYSGTKEFIAIVPGKAKSAATMVCFGASKIVMSPTTELGPIDPQWSTEKNGKRMFFSLCNVVASYKQLFHEAVSNKGGNLQPFLQQLSNYDAREIKEFEVAIQLAEDIAVRALQNGMMTGLTSEKIIEKIKVFLTPEKTKSHGRAIYYKEATECGLNIELLNLDSSLWQLLYELYLRLDNFTIARVAKCIESKSNSFSVNIPKH